jgi:hypothetical protein
MQEGYAWVGINCEFRPRIKELVAKTEDIQQKKFDYDDKWKQFKIKLGE